MRIQELYSRFRRALRDFGPARRGNVAVTFVVLCIPIIGGVGAAVDYSRANSIRAALQGALDFTALTLAKDAGTLTAAQLQTQGSKFFKAVFTRTDAKNSR